MESAPSPPPAEWLDRIRDYGWEQGSLVPPELWDHAVPRPGARALDGLDALIVISHDCDVVHGALEPEPVIEVIGARGLPVADPTYVHLRNPRVLHVESPGAVVQPVLEFEARNRGVIPRQKLAEFRPLAKLPLTALVEVTDWLGRRYVRPAFPDAFLDRLSKDRRRLERVMRRHAAAIVGVYVALNSWDEQPEDCPYRVLLRVVVDKDWWLSDPKFPERLDREFYDPLIRIFSGATGIVLSEHMMLPEHMFRLSDLKGFEQLDFDFIAREEGHGRDPVLFTGPRRADQRGPIPAEDRGTPWITRDP